MSNRKDRWFFLLSIMIFLLASTFSAGAKTLEPMPIYTEDGAQISPTAVWNSNRSEYFAIWYDEQSSSIYGAHVDPNGKTKGDAFSIVAIEDSQCGHSPSIAYDSSKDQYLVVWEDKTNDSLSIDIYAALVPFDGDVENTEFLTISKAEKDQMKPKVAWNGEQFLIVWEDYREGQISGSDKRINTDIYGILLDPNGELAPNSLEICINGLPQIDPVVKGFFAGGERGWLVSWVDERNVASGKDIYGGIVKQNGDIENSFSIYTADKNQKDVRLAVGQDSFFVVWIDGQFRGTLDNEGDKHGDQIKGLHISWDGYMGNPIVFYEFEFYNYSLTLNSSIAYIQNNFLVTWQDDKKIYGSRVSQWGKFDTELLSDPNTEATNPSIADTFSFSDSDDNTEGTLITWEVLNTDTLQDIEGVIYSPPEPPSLDWVGDKNFEEDGVHPDPGDGGDEFTFRVKYEKSEEGSSTPLMSFVLIDLNRNGLPEFVRGEVFQMEAAEEDSSIYNTEVTILYDGDPNVSYTFLFQDEFNTAVGSPAEVNWIKVRPNGGVPELDWLGTGAYMQDGIYPDTFEVDTEETFIFKVKYKDQDGTAPEKHQVWIDLNRNNIFEDPNDKQYIGDLNENREQDEDEFYTEKFTLELEEESEGKYSTGVTYSYEIGIPKKFDLTYREFRVDKFSYIGCLPYRFYFDDGANVAQGEPKNNKFLVITNTAEVSMHSGPEMQMNPDIVLNTQGGLVVWEDLRDAELEDPNFSQVIYRGIKIYGLFLDAENGEPMRKEKDYGEIIIGDPNKDHKNQFNPRIAAHNNIFLAVWEDLQEGTIIPSDKKFSYQNKDIYGQIIDSKDPNNRTQEFAIATYTGDNPAYMDQSNPAVATSGDNRFLVVWDDGINGSAYGKDIYGTIVSYDPNAGAKVHQDVAGYGGESFIIKNNKVQKHPAVAWANNARRYLAVWQDTGEKRLYANSLDPNGQVMGGFNIIKGGPVDTEYNREIGNPICIDRETNMYSPAIASDGDKFLIVWEHEEEGMLSDKDIYGIFVKPDCTVISIDPNGKEKQHLTIDSGEAKYIGNAKIAICTAKGGQTNPQVHWDKATGNYFVVWTSQPLHKNALDEDEYGSDTDIRGVWLNANGQLIGRESEDIGWEICAVHGIQDMPAISGNENIKRSVWRDNRNSPKTNYSCDIFSVSIKSLLNWMDGEDFSKGVNPETGGNGKEYTFRINYLNITNQDPNVCQLWIDLDLDGEFDSDEKFNMVTDAYDEQDEDGRIFEKELSVTLPEYYYGESIEYRFYFEDENGSPASGSANLRQILGINPPWLRFTGETNYETYCVYPHPPSGKVGDTFEFRVSYKYEPPEGEDSSVPPDITQLWINFNQDDEEQSNEKRALEEADPNDKDYTDGKIYYYRFQANIEEGSYNFRFIFEHPDGGPAVGIPTLEEQEFWVSSSREGSDGGLYKFDIQNEEWVDHFYVGKANVKLGGNFITALAVDGSDLWVGTHSWGIGKGVSLYNGSTWQAFTTEQGLASNLVNAIIVYDDYVWFGTLDGLSRYKSGEEWKTYKKPDLQQDDVTCLAVRNNILWVGTSGGLSYFDGSEWSSITSDSNAPTYDPNDIRYIKYQPTNAMAVSTKSESHDLYIGTVGGMAKYDGSNWTFYNRENTDGTIEINRDINCSIVKLVYDEVHSILWIESIKRNFSADTLEYDLIRYDISEGFWEKCSKEDAGVPNGMLYSADLAVDRTGDFWAAHIAVSGTQENSELTAYGLFRFKVDEEKWVNYTTTSYNQNGILETDFINKINGDDPRYLWVGAWPSGGVRPYTPADPNTVFRFPDRSCFTDSFSNMLNQKSILKHNPLGFWRIVLIMGFLCLGIGFFSIVRRYLWVRR